MFTVPWGLSHLPWGLTQLHLTELWASTQAKEALPEACHLAVSVLPPQMAPGVFVARGLTPAWSLGALLLPFSLWLQSPEVFTSGCQGGGPHHKALQTKERKLPRQEVEKWA